MWPPTSWPDALVPISLGNYLSPAYGGLGFAVVVDKDASPEPDNNGVHRWAGAANTFFWIDPAEELVGMVWMQYGEFAAYEIEREFQTMVYESIQYTTDECLIDFNPILPGQTSTFSCLTSTTPQISKFSVQFKELGGGSITTADRR